MFHKTLISILLVVVCCTSLARASDADYYITGGRQLMFNGTLSGLRMAYETFENGLNDPGCPDCNTSRELKFLHAVAGTAMLGIRDDNGSVNSVFELLKLFDVEVLGNYWAPYFEHLGLEFEPALNQYDAYDIPADAPDAYEVRDIIDTSMIPEIEAIIADLNSISDSPGDRFKIFLQPDEIRILFHPNSPVFNPGSPEYDPDSRLLKPVEVDYGEVLLLKGILMALKARLEAQAAYDLYTDPNDKLVEKVYGDSFKMNADLLDPHPDFLKVLPTSNDSNDGASVLAKAREDLIEGIDYYLEAVTYISSEEDPQDDEFLYIDPNDDFLVDMVNENLITLRDSLQNDTVMTYQLETKKTYDIYDVYLAPIGQLVLVYDFIDIEGDGGSLTFTDSNLAPSPWDVGWFCREDSSRIEIELEYHSESELRQGWFEGTLSDDGNSITDGTLEWWGSVVSCTATFYEVWGGNTYYGDQPNSWEYYYNINQQDYTKLGESDGQTATFPGDYNFYVIAAREEFFLDSVQGSTDDYYNGGLSTGNTSDPQNIWGPPDDQYATVGYQRSRGTFRGFVVITNPGNWTSITVIADRVCSPDAPESPLSGLSGQLVSTEVVEEINVDFNPVYGSSPDVNNPRYVQPVNLRDLLPVFDEWNGAQPNTVGHGLGDDATLGGIVPDMNQYVWQVEFDLQPGGLFYLDLINPSQIQLDGQVNDWTVDQLVFTDIKGDTEGDSNDIKGVDIKNVYMAYDSNSIYGAISFYDPATDPNQSRYYSLTLSYSPDNPSALDSLIFEIYAERYHLHGYLYHITYDEWGWIGWQYVADLHFSVGQSAVEFKIPFEDIPGDLPGRFLSVESSGWDASGYQHDGEENETHLRIAEVGTISGNITYNGYRGEPIFIQAYTDPEDPEESIVARAVILEPGPYTLDGIGLGRHGYVRVFTSLLGFNIFDLETPNIEASVSVFMSNTDVNDVNIVLNNPPILKKDIWVFGEIDTILNREDWYAFDAVKGVTYTLDVNMLTSQYASMTLFGRDGHTDIEERYYWQSQHINWMCPVSGRYYVKVTDTYWQPEGGTYQIRMTSDFDCPPPDIASAHWVGVKDCKVDFYDLLVLISHWLESNCDALARNESDWCFGTDLDQNGDVDMRDLAVLARYWLEVNNNVVREIWTDDFKYGDFANWSIVDEGSVDSPSLWSAITGQMVQSSNIYEPPTDGSDITKLGTYAWCAVGINWVDYSVSLKIRSEDDDTIGVMFRYQDNNNYYRFSWDMQRRYRRLVKKQGGVFTLLAEDRVPYVIGQTYQLKIVAQGAFLQVSIDGTVIFSVIDDSLAYGRIALYSWANVGSFFDDIVVEEIPAVWKDGDFSGWSIVDEGSVDSPSLWSATAGRMVQSSNIYEPPTDWSDIAKLGTYIWCAAGTNWVDYSMNLAIKSEDDDAMGVMFRYQDNDNYYRFSWDMQRRYRRLIKKEAGVFTLLAEDRIPYVIGQSYQLQITAKGAFLQASIDDTVIFSVIDDSLTYGSIALYSWANVGSFFENVVVKDL